jgi:hypothetical protein
MTTGPSVVSDGAADFVDVPLVIEAGSVVFAPAGDEGLQLPAATSSNELAKARATSPEMERILRNERISQKAKTSE